MYSSQLSRRLTMRSLADAPIIKDRLSYQSHSRVFSETMTRTNTDLFTKASLLSVLLDGDLTNSTGPSSYASPSNALVAADVRLHIRPGLSC